MSSLTSTAGDYFRVFPWDNTSANPYASPNTSTVTWPPPVEPHPAELESFEEFVIWACGFTDPDHPPSQRKWEEFQQKVQQLAADFVEYKRAKRERDRLSPPFTTSSVFGHTTSNL